MLSKDNIFRNAMRKICFSVKKAAGKTLIKNLNFKGANNLSSSVNQVICLP